MPKFTVLDRQENLTENNNEAPDESGALSMRPFIKELKAGQAVRPIIVRPSLDCGVH